MKNFKFLAAVLTALVMGFGVYSCQKDVVNNDLIYENEIVFRNSQDEGMNSENFNLLSFKLFNFKVEQLDNNYLKFTSDKSTFRYLKISDHHAKFINSNLEEVNVFINDETSIIKIVYEDDTEKIGAVHLAEFLVDINITNGDDTNEENDKRLPGETFQYCFTREWQDFCSDWSSCIVQAVHPVLIAGAIAISCA